MTAKNKKETIYLDQDDDITSVIDKLKKADAKVIALVLPKRYATLQSIVNLKLLKRSAKTSKKNIVLITSDQSVLPLAGTVGVHVAKTLQTKPEIPKAAADSEETLTVESDVEGVDADSDDPVDPKASIGSLAASKGSSKALDGNAETISVGDIKKPLKNNDKKDKKLKVPDFGKFRLKLIAGLVLLLLLGTGWLFATRVLPKATITVTTNTSNIDASLDFRAKSGLSEVSTDKSEVPAYSFETTKSSTEKVPTTGKKDVGNKASGTLTLTNCIDDSEEITIPAGTIFSAGGLNFVTTEAVTLSGAIYQSGSCRSDFFGESKNVEVTATEGGSKYNLSARSYSVPAEYNTADGSVLANGSDMSGGTTKLVNVVDASDVEAATQQALDKLSEAVRSELAEQFTADQGIAIETTLKNAKPASEVTPKVGEEANEIEVKVTVAFTMFGIKREDVTKLIDKEIEQRIDTFNQSITNSGLDDADIKLIETVSESEFRVELQTTAVVGPNLDVEIIKREIAGKKLGETTENISSRAGVTNVDVEYGPFWVFSTPNDVTKITINITSQNTDEQ